MFLLTVLQQVPSSRPEPKGLQGLLEASLRCPLGLSLAGSVQRGFGVGSFDRAAVLRVCSRLVPAHVVLPSARAGELPSAGIFPSCHTAAPLRAVVWFWVLLWTESTT